MLIAAGLVLLAVVVFLSLHLADLEAFLALARQAQPSWLAAALVCQLATYVCAAGVWWLALRGIGRRLPFPGLVPLSVAKMFLDQAVPSIGVSGSLFIVTALGKRGITEKDAMTTFAVGVGSYFVGFIMAVLVSLVLLSLHHGAPEGAIMAGLAGLGVILAAVTAGLVVLRGRIRAGHAPLTRWPKLARLLATMAHSAGVLISRPGLVVQGATLQLILRAFDGLTIWFCFLAIGLEAPLWASFAAIVIANATMFFTPVPMGLGTFEAGSVATLTLAGLPIETALTATLLFRGLSLWIPLVPGFFISQRELGQHGASAGP
jgi:uncharacterized protein (TIRG00374 family)